MIRRGNDTVARISGGALEADPDPQVKHLLELTGIEQLFPITTRPERLTDPPAPACRASPIAAPDPCRGRQEQAPRTGRRRTMPVRPSGREAVEAVVHWARPALHGPTGGTVGC